jgi:Rieske Fe-S protein
MALNINRREFLVLTAAAVSGCKVVDAGGPVARPAQRTVDAGPVGDYTAAGVYGRFRDQGFFIVRKGEELLAISAFCTHRKCKLIAETDHSFYCKCHGSTFDPGVKVTLGPARRDLPKFPASPDEHQRLWVTVPAAYPFRLSTSHFLDNQNLKLKITQ